MISRLYQRFVTGHGAVYTPPLLASLVIDQAMPYESMTGHEKLLDPSCGSGVFLVGALKRFVTHWRSKHRWETPSVDDLKNILSRSIFGVELEANAVDLTAFSLALAICDALEPPVIWKELKFDKLRDRNLREGDFFDPVTVKSSRSHNWPRQFDIVVGNPPFESNLTDSAKTLEAARPNNEPALPDKQIAYLFLERCLQLLSDGGAACLIQPHGLLYNSNPIAFRRHLMGLARLDTVLDFISIRGMFDEKDPKTIAWHAIRDDYKDEPVKHLTFRRTFSVSERISFEIDHYDWHEITPDQAMDDPFAWRINLLGGGRLHDVSQRLRSCQTLSDVVVKRGWVSGEGFVLGSGGVSADHLSGKPFLPTDALQLDGIRSDAITVVKEQSFYRPGIPERIKSPLLLIKEHATIPVAFWDRGPLAYRNKIVGIHAPAKEKKDLHAVSQVLKSRNRFYRFFSTVNGTQALIGKATAILKRDIDRLPMPDNLAELDLCFWEEALKEDVLTHMAEYVRLGQHSSLLNHEATSDDLHQYSTTYVRLLGSLYSNLMAAAPFYMNGVIVQPFYFGDSPDVVWLGHDCEEAINDLIYNQVSESLRSVRVVRYYEKNVILIVKPDRLRYWIQSTAIRDADDTLADLQEQGW